MLLFVKSTQYPINNLIGKWEKMKQLTKHWKSLWYDPLIS